MRKIVCATLPVACVLMASVAFAVPLYSNQSANPAAPALNPQLLSKSGVPAPAGNFWSEVQNDVGVTTVSNTNAGSSGNRVQGATGIGQFRLADDFTIPAGQTWQIDSVQVYGYQTGAAGVPVSAANLRIWSGRPGDGGSVVLFGDTTTNRLTSTVSSGLFRIFNTTTPPPGTAPGTTRRIWDNTLSVNTSLGAGTYWLDWQFDTINSAGTWFMPTTTHEGMRGIPGANARQLITAGVPAVLTWSDVFDDGNPTTGANILQDMPFIINGEIPEPMSLSVMGLAGLALLRRRRA